MADLSTTPDRRPAGPTTVEAFIADRQTFWSSFTRFVVFGVAGVVVLLILMTIFLV